MLVQIGQRAREHEIVDLLSECHGRIRRFLDLAHRLATMPCSLDEARDVAARVARYFAVGLPLHMADEEKTIVPRLLGRDPVLDHALAQLQIDHEEHGVLIAELARLCDRIACDPRTLASCAVQLDEATDRLTLVLEAHLTMEELVIFPALRSLSREERSAMRAEMRMRREVARMPS